MTDEGSSNKPTSEGAEVGKTARKSGGSNPLVRNTFYILLAILIAKALGLLKPYGAGPDEITFNTDLGFVVSGGLFVLLWNTMSKISYQLADLRERVAKKSGKLLALAGILNQRQPLVLSLYLDSCPNRRTIEHTEGLYA